MKKKISILTILAFFMFAKVVKADFTFGTPTKLGSTINTSSEEFNASISPDGLSLYFVSTQAGGIGGRDIWVTTRATTDEDWGEPVNLGPPINTTAGEWGVSISYDGLSLYFDTRQSGTTNAINDLWVATRATIDDDWGNPVSLGPTVNSGADDYVPSISADGLALYFTSGPGRGGYGNYDLWVTMRETTDDPWGEPVNLGPPVNSSDYDLDPGISSDGRMLFFTRGYGVGQTEIWVTRRATTDDPWGDGIVDVEDLIVLSDSLFEQVHDPALIAHWTFDETEGMFAADSVGDNDAVVLGGTEWQPASGQIDGALRLDCVSGYAVAGAVLNPTDGPFSIFAWVKGGAPEQVILSQTNIANWLCFDPLEGKLMTSLSFPPGRMTPPPLKSELAITNDEWHRIGFIRDGLKRMLYVDGIIVAEDTQNELASSYGGLYIGCGKGMESGSFFSGLIDDVRIYKRAVHP
jgi:hypothetical protein